MKKSKFFTRIHDLPVFKPDWRRCCSLSKTYLHGLLPERPRKRHHITPVLKPLYWLQNPERIHYSLLEQGLQNVNPALGPLGTTDIAIVI